MMDDENSNKRISLVVYPETHLGIHGLCMFNFIWIHITAPMKNEMSRTIPIESTPSPDISFIYCFMNMRIRSGLENERPMSIRYFPKLVRYLCSSILLLFLSHQPFLGSLYHWYDDFFFCTVIKRK